MAKLKRKQIAGLHTFIEESFPSLDEWIGVRDIKKNSLYVSIDDCLQRSSGLGRAGLQETAKMLGAVAHDVLQMYELEEGSVVAGSIEGYEQLFSRLAETSLILPQAGRQEYLTEIRKAISHDEQARNRGVEYQLVPAFATIMLDPAKINQRPANVEAAMETLRETYEKIGQKPAVQLFAYSRIGLADLTPETIAAYIPEGISRSGRIEEQEIVSEAVRKAAQGIIKEYGIVRVGSAKPGSHSASVWRDNLGFQEQLDLNYSRNSMGFSEKGMPREHAVLLKAMDVELATKDNFQYSHA